MEIGGSVSPIDTGFMALSVFLRFVLSEPLAFITPTSASAKILH